MNMITKGIFPRLGRSRGGDDKPSIAFHDAFWRHRSYGSDDVMTPFGVIGR